MRKKHRRFLKRVRLQMRKKTNRGDPGSYGGYLVRATIDIDHRRFGHEPHWSPGADWAELEPAELWVRRTDDAPEAWDVVVFQYDPQSERQVLRTGRVPLRDLLAVPGVYDTPGLLESLAIPGTFTATPLDDGHPVLAYARFADDMCWDVFDMCNINDVDHDCPPMPSLRRLGTGRWQIGFLIAVGETGRWDERDELDARFLAGMFDSYGAWGARWRITPGSRDRWYPPRWIWELLEVEPGHLPERLRDPYPDARGDGSGGADLR